MSEKKIHDPPETVILEEGIEVQQTKAYGVGIDTHSKFIQVSVYVKRDMKFFEYRREFSTRWNDLILAKQWILKVIETCSDPVPDLTEAPFHYCIESTSTYHFPILLAWEGSPSIINPTIAGSTKRKTDVLDAKLLALHDLIGVWPSSYLPSRDVRELRVLISERNRYVHEATAASNRINNVIVQFGLTIGREGSVSKNKGIRSTIEDQISEHPDLSGELCPYGIPDMVKGILRDEYRKYDSCVAMSASLKEHILQKALSMEWETAYGALSGHEMLSILTTAPQIGDLTAITWLAHIITPRRFPNSKAIAAYCGLDPSLKVSAKHVTSTTKRGGCKELHKALTSSADRLIRNYTEMFGRWGYNLYLQTGKWKKAANAVARKLAVALYYMMLTGQKFSYEKYSLVKNIAAFNIPVSALPSVIPDFKRYVRILEEKGIHTTSEMIAAYLSCELGSVKGLGKKFFSTIGEAAQRTARTGGSVMNNIMEYKGYVGSVEFSESDSVFFGKVQGIRSLISYEGTNASELVADFHGAIDDYLRLCEEEGTAPETAYKGSLNVRFKNTDIHRRAAIYAITHQQSLNSFIEEAVEEKLSLAHG